MSQKYDKEYKVQAVLLARKIGNSNAAKELKVPEGTLYGWIKAAKVRVRLGAATRNRVFLS